MKPSKCYWYLVDFQWERGEWSYKTTANTVCNILGDNKTGHNILSLPVEKAEKIMGVWQNLSGDNTTQIDAIIEKHTKMINRLRSSDMARKIVWKGFIGVLWSSIRYGLPSYAITQKESNRIFSKSFRPLFNSMGIHRTFPSEVAVLPYYYLGLNIPEPYIESGIARVITFINNMGSETLTSKFIIYTLQLMQLDTGQTNDVLLLNYEVLKNLATDSWIKSLWEFIYKHDIQITSPKIIIPYVIRENDMISINEFIRLGYTETDLVRLNRVRKHFKNLYMSDIT